MPHSTARRRNLVWNDRTVKLPAPRHCSTCLEAIARSKRDWEPINFEAAVG
jgi:hypothetical protein